MHKYVLCVLTLLACCTCDAVHVIHALSWATEVINVMTGGGGLQPRMTTSLPQQPVPCVQTAVVEFMVHFGWCKVCIHA
jgi:hypothetical protein